MASKTQVVGSFFEWMAACFLQTHGLVLYQKNFQCKYGEIDLIMRDGAEWVFVEVRYRKTSSYVTPLESISYHKQKRIHKSVWIFLNQLNSSDAFRIDIIGVTPKQAFTQSYINTISLEILAKKSPKIAQLWFKSFWKKRYNFEWIPAAF
ncbi:MAG: YraN family protein [Pseudomonadota bacterium]